MFMKIDIFRVGFFFMTHSSDSLTIVIMVYWAFPQTKQYLLSSSLVFLAMMTVAYVQSNIENRKIQLKKISYVTHHSHHMGVGCVLNHYILCSSKAVFFSFFSFLINFVSIISKLYQNILQLPPPDMTSHISSSSNL